MTSIAPDDDRLGRAYDTLTDEIDLARGIEKLVDVVDGVDIRDRLPLQIMMQRHVATLTAIHGDLTELVARPAPADRGVAPPQSAAAGAATYDPRQFLEIGPRVVAQDADRVAVVVPIARARLHELRPLLDALRAL
jgi:hypothetical protein